MIAEGHSDGRRRPHGAHGPRRRRLGRAARLLAAALFLAGVPALAASAAQGAEPPVITGVSPDHGVIGFEGIEEHPPITITGQNLAGATVTAPDFWRESGEQAFEVVEDSETSLVVKSYFANVPGVRRIVVHTPGGTAVTSVTYTPRPGRIPLIGRCRSGGSEGGEYLDSKCTRKIGSEGVVYPFGKFDWTVGLASPTVTFTGGAFGFRYAPRVTCASVDGTGSLLDAREVENVVLTFHGCEYQGAECSNTASAGDVETFPLLLSLGWWRKNFPRGKQQPAVGLFAEQIEGTIAQFQCGSESIAFGGGWEAPVQAAKAKTSLPFTFGVAHEGKEEAAMIHEQWVGWGAQVVPLMKVDGEDNGMAGPWGTLSMNAPEPFLLNKSK